MNINFNNCIKYFTQLIVVTIASYLLSPCKVKLPFAMTLGFISSSLFAILDTMYPYVVIEENKSR